MRITVLLIGLICSVFLVVSCTSEEPAASLPAGFAGEATEEAVLASPPSAEAVYIYNSKAVVPSRLLLTFAGEPILFPFGYVRLAGVVSGWRPVAYIEIGGRGLALREGELINDHRVARITDHSVLLERSR